MLGLMHDHPYVFTPTIAKIMLPVWVCLLVSTVRAIRRDMEKEKAGDLSKEETDERMGINALVLFFSFAFTSAWVLPSTFLMIRLPVSGWYPAVYRPSQRPSLRFRIFPSPFARRFGIKSAPFDNEQYRKQGNKATRKSNCYQKVIICPSEPCRLIFDYCGAIFALPEAFFFGYSGAIFERSKVSFH